MKDQTVHDVAIIGGGIAGLTCARTLAAAGLDVRIYDKSRGAGGRLCTRRRGAMRFDHGAQYFTARHPEFVETVSRWHAAGVVSPWRGQFGVSARSEDVRPDLDERVRWVGAPRMSVLGRSLSEGLCVSLSTRIVDLTRQSGGWRICDEHGHTTTAQRVLVSCPGPQAAALLPHKSPLHSRALGLEYAPCWALMASFAGPIPFPFDGVRFTESPMGWIARDSSKPGRESGERWVVHASPNWSAAHLELEVDEAGRQLAAIFSDLVGESPVIESVHRWRYALTTVEDGSPALWDAEGRLGLFGDGLSGPRVEAAWLSGCAMADQLLTDP